MIIYIPYYWHYNNKKSFILEIMSLDGYLKDNSFHNTKIVSE